MTINSIDGLDSDKTDSEHDWREGSDQYKWIENWYAQEGSFEEPMGREHLQKLWQKYKVDITFYGHDLNDVAGDDDA
ncbi:purple acid phosphatase [Artemisia annua]|uniref:Purple acid phosphatase n=1 Tax=Artemisia annua TaxID=35608 RepID=A0A2U1KNJ5_ARTAN|nr:purple acid phosphatase [Artemisia annua]